MNALLLARRESELRSLTERLARSHPDRSVAYRVHDLADGGDGRQEAVVREILADEDRSFALLVYNAAHGPVGTFASSPLGKAYQTVQVNVRSILAFVHAFVGPDLDDDPSSSSSSAAGRRDADEKKKRGVVLMSSLTGETGMGYVANYAATKSWTTAFAHGLRYELEPRGVEVLACVAGATATPNYVSIMGEDRDRRLESEPEEVVRGCLARLGRSSSAAPGWKNRFFRFLMTSVLPTSLAVRLSSETMEPVLARKRSES